MKLTVFTPTFNRADKLVYVYKSLLKQNTYDFEWLIIDDGSEDNTESVVNEFIAKNNIVIRYIKKENGGKHTAYNEAVSKAEGDFFLCLDSDDYLVEGALNYIVKMSVERNTGLIMYKVDQNRNMLGNVFPEKICNNIVSLHELKVNGCTGEYAFVFPTSIAKKYPFPIFEGEKFVTESIVYDQIAKECQFLLVPEVVMICEYQKDGYTRNIRALMKNNPNAYALYFAQKMDEEKNLKNKIVFAGKYCCFRRMERKKIYKYCGKNIVLVYMAHFLGIVFYIYYQFLEKKF